MLVPIGFHLFYTMFGHCNFGSQNILLLCHSPDTFLLNFCLDLTILLYHIRICILLSRFHYYLMHLLLHIDLVPIGFHLSYTMFDHYNLRLRNILHLFHPICTFLLSFCLVHSILLCYSLDNLLLLYYFR